jgi:hypothetical protein
MVTQQFFATYYFSCFNSVYSIVLLEYTILFLELYVIFENIVAKQITPIMRVFRFDQHGWLLFVTEI